MDNRYHVTFEIIEATTDKFWWSAKSHRGETTAVSPSMYSTWHGAKKAMDRHIKTIQSAKFTAPTKKARKSNALKS